MTMTLILGEMLANQFCHILLYLFLAAITTETFR